MHGAPAISQPARRARRWPRWSRPAERKLRFGVVHQTSSHNYELRYWLAASGIVPDRDIEIVVLPPPLLPDALGRGGIDGYCVGEPWNSVGVATEGRAYRDGQGLDLAVAARTRLSACGRHWAEANPELVAALIRVGLPGGASGAPIRANHAEIAADHVARRLSRRCRRSSIVPRADRHARHRRRA